MISFVSIRANKSSFIHDEKRNNRLMIMIEDFNKEN